MGFLIYFFYKKKALYSGTLTIFFPLFSWVATMQKITAFILVQICEVGGVSDHPHEDLAKFGYRKVKKFINCAKIVLYLPSYYYLNMEIFFSFFPHNVLGFLKK